MPGRTKFSLNDKERAVLAAFVGGKKHGTQDKALFSLSDLAAKAFKKKGSSAGTKGNSWTRNSLRKLVRFGLVGHHGVHSGLYFRTDVKVSDLGQKLVGQKLTAPLEA